MPVHSKTIKLKDPVDKQRAESIDVLLFKIGRHKGKIFDVMSAVLEDDPLSDSQEPDTDEVRFLKEYVKSTVPQSARMEIDPIV